MCWLITRESETIPSKAGTSSSLSQNVVITIPANDWADFTLPFTFEEGVTFGEIKAATEAKESRYPIFSFSDGAFVNVTVAGGLPDTAICKPSHFYFAYNNSASDMQLVIPPLESSESTYLTKSASREMRTLPQRHWYAVINSADSHGKTISELVIGNSPDTSVRQNRVGPT